MQRSLETLIGTAKLTQKLIVYKLFPYIFDFSLLTLIPQFRVSVEQFGEIHKNNVSLRILDNMQSAFACIFQFSLSHWAQEAAGHEDHTAGLGHEFGPVNCVVSIIYSLTFALHICILPHQALSTRLPICDSFPLSTVLLKPSAIGLFTNFSFQEWKLSIKFCWK